MTRQYNTIFCNTVECDKKNIQKIQIHLLHNVIQLQVNINQLIRGCMSDCNVEMSSRIKTRMWIIFC